MKRTDLWPREREERLTELAPSASCTGDLAVALKVSKNSIIGKLHRMRKHGHVIETNFTGKTGRPRNGDHPPCAVQHVPPPPKPRRGLPPPDPVRPAPALEIFTMRRLTLLQLGPRTCRWPVGDPGTPEFCFCGNTTAADRSYCPVHHNVAHYRGNR